jgi:dienelactone hydrolase
VDFLHQLIVMLCRNRTNSWSQGIAGRVGAADVGFCDNIGDCFESGQMNLSKPMLVFVWLCGIWAQPVAAQSRFGPQGPEGAFMRMQPWLLPSPEPGTPADALLYRPPGEGPFPLALIAHASTQNLLRRAQMPAPEYRALAGFLVAHGFAVLVPQRPGHGATGGRYLEDQGGCADADYSHAGRATADSIVAALVYLRGESFVRKTGTVVLGHSAGGWGALALGGQAPQGIAAIIAFAPGRGGHADDRPGNVCAPEKLLAAASEFGQAARIPVLWLVADNDSYFPPTLSKQLAEAFRRGGGKATLETLPAFGDEGHWLAERDGGEAVYGAALQRALPKPPMR